MAPAFLHDFYAPFGQNPPEMPIEMTLGQFIGLPGVDPKFIVPRSGRSKSLKGDLVYFLTMTSD